MNSLWGGMSLPEQPGQATQGGLAGYRFRQLLAPERAPEQSPVARRLASGIVDAGINGESGEGSRGFRVCEFRQRGEQVNKVLLSLAGSVADYLLHLIESE